MRRLLIAGCFALALTAAPPDAKDCVACHDQVDLEKRRAFSHGGLACVQCHTAITELPHPEKLPPVKCSRCHKKEAEDYAKSVHGLARLKRNDHAATCASCHGKAHEIISPRDSASELARKNMYSVCGKCHDQDHLSKLPARLHRRGSRMNIQPLKK
jgi:hypothetical protein